MTDPTRPVTGYPAQPTNGYPPPQQPPPQQSNYYYPNYNNQPQQPYYPHPHAPPPPPRAALYRRAISSMIATFIIFGVILFILWLILRPRLPVVTVTSFTISSLNTTTTPAAAFSAVSTTRLLILNPNRHLHAYYSQISARLYYKSAFLTQNELPPFDQPNGDQTAVNATLVASSSYVDGGILKEFEDDRGKGRVEFDLQVIAIAWFNRGGWRGRKRILRILCEDLGVNLSSRASNGSFSGGDKRCAVGLS